MKSLTCLLIEDDSDDQDMFIETVKKISQSITCFTAPNGRVGIEKLVDEHLRPDVIFLDLNMPIMNGAQFLLEFKKHEALKQIPVIVLTTASKDQIPHDVNIKDFFTKPDTIHGWEEKIKKAFSDFISTPRS